MDYFNMRNYFNIGILSLTYFSFVFTTLTIPVLNAFEIPINANEAFLLAKIEKIVEKFKKLKKSKDKKKIYKLFYEFRKDLESDLGVKFNVKEALKEIKKTMAYGPNFDEKLFDAASREVESCSKNGDYKEDKKIEVKGSLAFGITIALAGCFLYATKIPILQRPAQIMIGMGIETIRSSMCDKMDEKSSKKKKAFLLTKLSQ